MDNLTLIIHLFYPGSWRLIQQKCQSLLPGAANIIITACYDEVISEVENLPGVVILKVPNKGKDIGGKMAAISYYLNHCERTEYIAFLHDKISPQTLNVEYWQNKLYSLFEPVTFRKVMNIFSQQKNIGISGSKAFLKNEYNVQKKSFDTTNNELLMMLIERYQLKCSSYNFIAGTIFIGRSSLFEKFFGDYSPLLARAELEDNNVLDLKEGTYTHCWERLLCFIANHYKYEVSGIG